MFRGRKQESLPTASYSNYNQSPFSLGNRHPRDGSGRAIRMEAPIVRAWRNSSVSTKVSYYLLLITFLFILFGIYKLRNNHASIWLTCNAVECTLEITPPGRKGTKTLKFSKKQLVRSEAIIVDKYNNFVTKESGRRYGTSTKKDRAGPDSEGNYDTYTIHLRDPISSDGTSSEDSKLEVSLSSLDSFMSVDKDSGNKVLNMRQFNLGQSKRRTSTMTNKLDSYILNRRHSVIIKENTSISALGMFSLVIGLFGILLTALVGQFWDEDEPKTGGPGVRRNLSQKRRGEPVLRKRT